MDTIVINLAVGVGFQNFIGWFAPILLGVTNVVPLLLALFFYSDKSAEYNNLKDETGNKPPDLDYDFIVVGAGTAGSIVANRLSKHFNVLLLERGGEPNPLTSIPGLQSSMLGRPETDYRYMTVPQNSSCLSCNNRQGLWNQGFGLGGSSILNAMAYIRAHPFDYDSWADWTNDERWKYKNLVSYFRRSEGYCDDCDSTTGIKPTINPYFHSSNGEMPVRPSPFNPFVPEYLDAMEWAGIHKGDVNAPYYNSITDVSSYTQKMGRRITSYKAFIEPILGKRPTLRVIKYARVIRVLFASDKNEAFGVEYETFGKLQVAKVSKEVILSAGAIGTPKVLLLSGVGPAQELNDLKIPVRANLPVGRNLQDHIGTSVGPFLLDKPVSILPERDLTQEAADAFLQNGTGPFAVPFPRTIAVWTSSKTRRSGWPDVLFGMAANGVSQNMDEAMSQLYNLRADVMKEFFDPVKGHDAFSLVMGYGRPRSRGTLKLRSSNYIDEPLIDPRYYEDREQEDIKVIVEAIQELVIIAENAPSLKQLNSRLSPVPFPTCKHTPFRSAEYWECVARHLSLTLHHFCGTASMGPDDSPDAVVDSELKVIGIKGLRVIDASVMPFIVTTNTMAPTMMIAERGADFVIDSWLV